MLSAVSTSSTDVTPSPVRRRGSLVGLRYGARASRRARQARPTARRPPTIRSAPTARASSTRSSRRRLRAPANSTLPMTMGMRALRGSALWGAREASRARSGNVAGIGGTRSASSSVCASQAAAQSSHSERCRSTAARSAAARRALRCVSRMAVTFGAVHAISPMRAPVFCRPLRATCRVERARDTAAL